MRGRLPWTARKPETSFFVNYQSHPLLGTGSTDPNVHSDAPGVFREHLEKELDRNAVYITGTSCNVEFKTRLTELNRSKDYKDHAKMLAYLTIVCTSANSGNGYISSVLGHSHGCYETHATKFVAGTGEELRDEFLTMLNSLHG